MITRKFNWIPSINGSNRDQIEALEKKLASFYAQSSHYYGNIDFTADNWINDHEAGYKQIAAFAFESNKVCEFGCGASNILKHFPELQSRYSGCDFSEELLNANKKKYPAAGFVQIKAANELPYHDELFDLVFSVFVLEHATDPSKLLDECYRLLQKGGRLVIMCPDFLGCGRMTSQRAGWSEGNSREKLKKRKFLDAILTYFDNRIRIPIYSKKLRDKIKNKPQFLVNITPTVFSDVFIPDADAVYITYKEEIIKYLENRFVLEKNTATIEAYTESRKLIFLSFIKK